jgi:hypothetical protein
MIKKDHSTLIIKHMQEMDAKWAVGFPAQTTGAQKYEGGQTLASVAAANEYGHKNVPPRPFMQTAANEFESKPNKIREALEQGIVKNGEKALELLAMSLSNEIRNQISRGSFAPNAPYTKEKKGSSRPLIDTGKMLGGVDQVKV